MRTYISLVLVVTALLLSGCSNKPMQPKVYKMVGTIVSTQPDYHQATIDHKAIPGFMEAMTMPYIVRDTAELKKLSPGDEIQADVFVNPQSGEVWLGNISVTKHSSQQLPTSKRPI